MGVLHFRKFISNESEIRIDDFLEATEEIEGTAYFHFHPKVTTFEINETSVDLPENACQIVFKGKNIQIEKESYNYVLGFNTTTEAFKLKVTFTTKLETKIIL